MPEAASDQLFPENDFHLIYLIEIHTKQNEFQYRCNKHL